MGEIYIRNTGTVTSVDYPRRTITLVVAPYNEETIVEHRGRVIKETIAPGAFDGIERRANRVRVNYHHQDHELRHQLGHAVSFHPSEPRGLVALVRIRKGEHGDSALELADDGDLGASAGFGIMEGGEEWPSRQEHRLTRLFLDHIALTPTPAYEGAQVLAVRAQAPAVSAERPATPVADALELQIWAERLAEMDARWIRPPAR